jgi:solute:Na+ symporter, SSS family
VPVIHLGLDDYVIMAIRLFPSGMLGLGLTALLASFMSGMAGNVTAFNTVWAYDIYRSHTRRQASDRHYLMMGRVTTVVERAGRVCRGE